MAFARSANCLARSMHLWAKPLHTLFAGRAPAIFSPAVLPIQAAVVNQGRSFAKDVGTNMEVARQMNEAAQSGKPHPVVATMKQEDANSELGIAEWGIWEKEVSKFDWFFKGTEVMYILEGKATVTPTGEWASCKPVSFEAGSLVTFPVGMTAIWDVKQPIKKHFAFPFGKPLAD